MKTKVFYAESVPRLKHLLNEALSADFNPGLAIVFSSVFHDMETVRKIFSDEDIMVFGASTAGEIVNKDVLEETIAVMLLDIPRSAFSLSLFQADDQPPASMGHKVADWAMRFCKEPSVLLMIAGGFDEGEKIVKGILDRAGDQTALYGCTAAYDPAITMDDFQTFVFSHEIVSTGGVVALALDPDQVTVQGMPVSGWKGIGTPKTITGVSDNIVHTINQTPAMDVINRYLRIGDDPDLAMEYPLLWEREDGSWAMRVIVGITPDKSIVLSGSFPENAKVRFGMSPGVDIINFAEERLKTFEKETGPVDAMLLYSCRARYLSLGPMINQEVAAVQAIWNTPAVGAFTFGEIGPGHGGTCEFHNHVLVPVLISW